MDPLLRAQLHLIAALASTTQREAQHNARHFDLRCRLDELQRLIHDARRRLAGGTGSAAR